MVWNKFKTLFKAKSIISSKIPLPDYEELAATSHFSKSELEQLFARFCFIANKMKGKVEVRNFLLQPEILHCGIAAFALNWVMEKERKDAVDFPIFVEVLSCLSAKASRMENVEFLFDMVRKDDSPTISIPRFRAMLNALSRGTLSDRSLRYICDRLPKNMDVHMLNRVLHDHDMLQYLSTPFA